MKRRTAIKIVALGALAPKLDAPGAVLCHPAAGTAWSASDYELRFFTPKENELVDQLMEMIIPADAHSPGAHEAQASLFADLMVATSSDAVKARWRNGLRLMREEAGQSSLGSLAAALAKASAHEGAPQTELERFFTTLKNMAVNGYYTSAIGIHQDLQYQGNTYISAFPECAMPNIVKKD
ncbi:MAG TPA: gluconate 2-dehydrogenase subunit 3 family protein [Terriglobia bacterium]|nr:gluconate 2-dehydrogenase subunit 3 family protein [Terriglobia bacterium]HEV2247503.1 gluconate 2-dehydrogenase subunit 3 family protein [Terriglobia bacterium]